MQDIDKMIAAGDFNYSNTQNTESGQSHLTNAPLLKFHYVVLEINWKGNFDFGGKRRYQVSCDLTKSVLIESVKIS